MLTGSHGQSIDKEMQKDFKISVFLKDLRHPTTSLGPLT